MSDRFAATRRRLDLDVHHFPEGTRTAADAAAAVGCDVAHIVKSLVFIGDGSPIIVLSSGANRVPETRLAAAIGCADLRRATPDEAKAATGYTIGGTPPLGHVDRLPTFIDRHLLTFATVWAAAGTADTCFAIDPARLAAETDATVVDLADE